MTNNHIKAKPAERNSASPVFLSLIPFPVSGNLLFVPNFQITHTRPAFHMVPELMTQYVAHLLFERLLIQIAVYPTEGTVIQYNIMPHCRISTIFTHHIQITLPGFRMQFASRIDDNAAVKLIKKRGRQFFRQSVKDFCKTVNGNHMLSLSAITTLT